MKRKLILAIDQGTTNTKVLLIDGDGSVAAGPPVRFRSAFPNPVVEQDAVTLWSSVVEAIDACLEQAGDAELAAIGVTNQRESVVVWDRKSGEPAARASSGSAAARRVYAMACAAAGWSLSCASEPDWRSIAVFREQDPLASDNIPDGQSRAEAGGLLAGTVDSWSCGT